MERLSSKDMGVYVKPPEMLHIPEPLKLADLQIDKYEGRSTYLRITNTTTGISVKKEITGSYLEAKNELLAELEELVNDHIRDQ